MLAILTSYAECGRSSPPRAMSPVPWIFDIFDIFDTFDR